MRIKKLKISNKNYKNLDINIENNTSGIMAFIGNNGSGKSNLLEAISIIFKYFYEKKEKDIPFDFSLTYTIGGKNEIEITKKKTSVITKIDGNQRSDPYGHLPKQIVAIYSGEEDRLWQKYYRPFYDQYIFNINKSVQNEMPKMLYINKFYWHISLLCLLLHRFYNGDDTFCKNILGIKNVHSVKFSFNKNNYKNYTDSLVKQFITRIDKKDEYTLEELIKIIDNEGYTIIDIYKYLYIAFTPKDSKMIENIVIKYNDENLELEDFSEGEKKMLLIKSALEFAGQEDSLFILDEPDAHIHLANKIQIRKVFEPYEDHRQIIITTHSPTLVDSLNNDALYMLHLGKLVPNEKQKIIENVAGEFWNKIQQNSFLSSKKPIILLVEGKLDKSHISNAYNALKEDYKDLEFDVFCLNSETKIKPFLEGLYESDFETNKLYIGLFDREKKILDDLKNPKNYEKIEGETFYKIKENGKQNIKYFVTTLPKLEDKECDCSIEMMYDYTKWENAYYNAVKNTIGKTKNKSIKNYSDDILDDAKNILAEHSKNFIKGDFVNFRELFNIIRDVKKYSDELGKISNSQNLDNHISQPQNYIEIITDARASDVSAWFFPDDEKVILKKGSKLPKNEVESYDKKQKENRQKELKKVAKTEKEFYILEQDKEFSSVSTALNFALGRSSNGWKVWKIKNNGEILETIRKN